MFISHSADISQNTKYWLATSVLYFSVRFGADFFYNIRPIQTLNRKIKALYYRRMKLILESKNEN